MNWPVAVCAALASGLAWWLLARLIPMTKRTAFALAFVLDTAAFITAVRMM